MYTVYGKPTTRTFRVLWALEEMGEPYDLVQMAPQSPEITALNPSGKVPAFKDGETVITDSTAIITYLADKHGKLTHPAGTLERAKQDALTHMVLDEIDAVLWTAARHSFVLPQEKRCPEVKSSLKWEFETNLARLSAQFDGPFLQGDTMTIADIILTHCLNWAFSAKFPVGDEKIQAYAKQMRSRDAFRNVAALMK
ncbi:glutathione S-transferase family protein [Aliisedimentitalea scapharcae]|uniref:Glutathione S-transferase family protein n=1 Tax=Aliisedimentitalea scapharcae TaxID=1524259 RepID=A0ABZ2XRX2_9RHOB